MTDRATLIRTGQIPRSKPGDICPVCQQDHSSTEPIAGFTAEQTWAILDDHHFFSRLDHNEAHEWRLARERHAVDFTEYGDPQVRSTGECGSCGSRQCRCGR